MRRSALFLASTLGLAGLPASALDVSGNVLDKMGAPISGAKVCVKSDANTCVTTGSKGDFHITKGVGIRPVDAGVPGFDLSIRNGSLWLTVPAATQARLEWLSPDGRRAWSAASLRLSAGRNAVAMPRSLPRAGLTLIRLSTPDHVMAWKAVVTAGVPSAGGAANAPRVLALSKAAAGGTLEITKSGYRTRTYEPASETETDVVIFLSATDDVGLTFGGTFDLKVIAIDKTKHTLITESTDAYCDDSDKVVHETTRDTSNYAIRDGKLWSWVDGDCTGQLFTGSGTDLVGTWTLVDPNAELPDDLKAGCVPDTSSGGDDSPFDNFTASYTVSDTKVSSTVSAEICPADLYGPLLAIIFSDDSTITLSKNTCKQVVFKNGKAEDGTLDFGKKGDSLVVAFTYKTTTCNVSEYFGFTEMDPVCPEGDEFTPFLACLAGSGFADLPPIMKAAAGSIALPRPAMSLERRVPGWLPLPVSRDPATAVRAIRAEAKRAMSIFGTDGRRNAR